MGGLMAQGASPRQKVAKMADDQSKHQIIMHFVKSNLKLFLRLVSTDIHQEEASLTANEFNSLRVLFRAKETLAPLTKTNQPQQQQQANQHQN